MGHQNAVYFSVDSRLLFQLGEKLVTDRAVALAELVKNSYDADATQRYCPDGKYKKYGWDDNRRR